MNIWIVMNSYESDENYDIYYVMDSYEYL